MSIKNWSLVWVLLFSIPLFSQINVQSLMTKRFLSCDDILVNNAELLPEYYRAQSQDTLQALVDYWKQECGPSDFVLAFDNLIRIQNRQDLQLDDNAMLHHLQSYISGKNFFDGYFSELLSQQYLYGRNRLYLRYADLYDLIKTWATGLLNRGNLSPDHQFILDVYAGHIKNINALKKPPYSNTALANQYTEAGQTTGGIRETIFSFYTGLWMPDGHLALLGNHPKVGVRYGVMSKKTIWELNIGGAFLKSQTPYLAKYAGTIKETDHFENVFLGLNFGYKLYQHQRQSIFINAGVAYEGLMTFKYNEDDDNDDNMLHTFNFNMGATYMYQFINHTYLALEAKYNIVRFKNTGGTDLSGNYFGINLIYGFKFSPSYFYRRF